MYKSGCQKAKSYFLAFVLAWEKKKMETVQRLWFPDFHLKKRRKDNLVQAQELSRRQRTFYFHNYMIIKTLIYSI